MIQEGFVVPGTWSSGAPSGFSGSERRLSSNSEMTLFMCVATPANESHSSMQILKVAVATDFEGQLIASLTPAHSLWLDRRGEFSNNVALRFIERVDVPA